MTHFESDTRWARPRSRICDLDSSMAMMVWVHVWFRPFRDELSLTRDDGRAAQKRKGQFRRKNGETPKAGRSHMPVEDRGEAPYYLNRLVPRCRARETNPLHYDDRSLRACDA